MLLTNLKVYLKFLGRNRAYTAINLAGFSIALVFVILLGLYVADESRADRFHERGDRIFRLQDEDGTATWPAPAGPELAARYPEIESYVRVDEQHSVVDKGDGAEKVRARTLVADSTFFRVFSYPLAAGDCSAQLRTSGDVTLSEEFAARLFGAEDPVGKPLDIDGEPHTVTGVVGRFPLSHLATPDIIVRFDDTHIDPWYFTGYNSANFALYLVARPGADLTAKGGDMAEWFKTFFWIYKNGIHQKVTFEPLAECYFNTKLASGMLDRSNSRGFIGLLAAAVMAILLFAVINYVNLSVALGGFRAKEAAMRRLLGGSRRGLLAAYMFESVVFCAIAMAIALVLTKLAEPVFNGVMGSEVSLTGALCRPVVIAAFVGGIVVLGLLSGISPALVITRVQPIDVVKGEFTRRTRMVYSRLFIGLQFCLTMVLLGCALTIGRQTHFLRTTDLGFDKTNLLYFDNTLKAVQTPGLRDRLMQIPGVEMVSFTQGTPVNGGNNNTNTYDDGTTVAFQVLLGDSLMMKMLDIEVVSRTAGIADSALWINQTAARMINLAPDADRFEFNGRDVALAGVVRDFHIRNLRREMSPVVLGPIGQNGDMPWDILVKVSPGNPAETYRRVQEAYMDYNGGEPVDSGFADASIDGWYDDQRRTGRLIGGFSALAIVISAMGLVAMSTYFMRQRRRDIAVRKVFGATNAQVLGRLVGGFMRIVAAAFVVAVPLIWWLMTRWLSTYPYRISLGWTTFVLAGAAVGAMAFAAVWWQSRVAARRNPVESLNNN